MRLFRVSGDGRALTTSLIEPGTIFGEMILLGQHMYDNYAEALDEVAVCVLNRSCVQQYLLSDARIAGRITAILGQRLRDVERRLSDNVFKSVPQRLAGIPSSTARHWTQRRARPAEAPGYIRHEHPVGGRDPQRRLRAAGGRGGADCLSEDICGMAALPPGMSANTAGPG
ncbi:Crp/Fnr family transcriptional regulator, partial [Micromonospora deserti]|uniref:Crp/Fnr family transcriptional regulator n=1 Tax=Micromonospora deserti TaxID=2070366 RepID=UPI001F454358